MRVKCTFVLCADAVENEDLHEAAPEVVQGTAVPRVAGRLRARLAFWRTFCVSSIVLSWIAFGFPLHFLGGVAPPAVQLRNGARFGVP